MKKNPKFEVLEDTMRMNPKGKMEYHEQKVTFRKGDICHSARIVTYVDIKKGKRPKLVALLTNGFDMPVEEIVNIFFNKPEEDMHMMLREASESPLEMMGED